MLLDYIQQGNSISVSYYAADGKTHIETINLRDDQMFNWEVCPESAYSRDKKYVSWDGKAVRRVPATRLTNFRMAEIIDDLPKEAHDRIFEYALPRTFFVDIETEIDPELSVKESAETAMKPITVIGIATPDRQIIVLSSFKDLTPMERAQIQADINNHTKQFGVSFDFSFRCFNSEARMLDYFLTNMVARFPMMSGWNFVDFDWKYIVNRCDRLKPDVHIEKASPIKKLVGKNRFPAHVGVVDYMECYQKWDTSVAQKENLKLDQAGLDVLGVRKVAYTGTLDDLYRDDFPKYVYYNAIDCILVEMLHEKLGVSSIGNTLTYIAKCPTMRMFSPVSLTESILARDYYARDRVLPAIKGDRNQEPYEGAYVKKPKIGFHKCCICNDFASLYPNIMRELNLSPETLVVKLAEDDEVSKQKYLDKGYIVSASGCVFRKDPGVFSTLVGRVYNQRKSYKKTAVNAAIKARLLEDLLRENITDEKELQARYEQIMNS